MFVSARPVSKPGVFKSFPPFDGPEKKLDPIGPEEKQRDGEQHLN
jgi:hypothetical protein